MENNSIYSYKIRQVPCTLDNIRTIQSQEISILDSYEKDMLFDNLERGTDIISHELQMCMYMYSYEKMHKAKMFDALEHAKFLSYQDIEIIDYGCGQGLGTLAVIEYMKTHGYNISNIKSVTLIEPSKICINRAHLHVNLAHPHCKIKIINKTINDIKEDELKSNHYCVLHIFSNILDIESVDINNLVKITDKGKYFCSEYICVGPYFGESSRQRRYDYFGNCLGIESHYYVDYDKGEWINNWTYSARLFFHHEENISFYHYLKKLGIKLVDAGSTISGGKFVCLSDGSTLPCGEKAFTKAKKYCVTNEKCLLDSMMIKTIKNSDGIIIIALISCPEIVGPKVTINFDW